ncbi:MAG TPA: aspartate kinase [Bacteroidota bacterium]|nr:aspartate kinase [Bacteroidota bacterium]
MITMKFGGTSIQDADAITRVTGIVRASLPKSPVVVISAIAQATNALEKIGKSAGEGNAAAAKEEIDTLLRRHITIVNRLIRTEGLKKDLAEYIAETGVSLNNLASGVEMLRELTPRTMDAFYSFGELLSSRIVAAALVDTGISAQWLDSKDFLVTDDNFNRARPIMHIVEERLLKIVPPLLKAGKVPVTQGFIGVTVSGHRTTMGRESSDYTGSLIGGALGAEAIEIWTDVTGVLTADPRIVENPIQVKHLTFAEAYELTYFGAKVLHPSTMHPAEARNIPIDILNSLDPSLEGTRVSTVIPGGGPAVKSVTYRKDVSVLTLTPMKRHGQYIFWEHIYGVLTERRAEALLMNTAEYRVAIVLKSADASEDIREALKDVCHAEIRPGKALLCAVGENMVNVCGVPERFLRAVGSRPVYFLSLGASPNSLAAVIDAEVIEETVRRAHAEFFTR